MGLLFDQKDAAAQLDAVIKSALADAQARGVALEDHEAEVLTSVLHVALLEVLSDVSGALAPAVAAIEKIAVESAAWRAEIGALIVLLQRLDGATLHLGPALSPIPDAETLK